MTKHIYGDQGTGKTWRLIEWILEGRKKGLDRVILTSSQQHAAYLRRESVPGGRLTATEVSFAGDWDRNQRGRENVEIAVDDTEQVLIMLLRIRDPRSLKTLVFDGVDEIERLKPRRGQ